MFPSQPKNIQTVLPFGVKSALLQPADPCGFGAYFKPVRPLTTFSPPQQGHSDVTGVGLQLKGCSWVWLLFNQSKLGDVC